MTNRAQQQARRTAAVSMVVNVALTALKVVIGGLSGSRALLADAVHSGADVVGSIAVMVGLRVANKPPDRDHPYGHGKAELLSSALVALILFAASVEVAYTSLRALFAPAHPPEILAAYGAAVSILVKEWMYRWNYRVGRRMNSQSLLASAYDHRSDVYASMAALVGILLAIAGKHAHIHWLMYMDDIAGAAVAVLVMRMAWRIARDSMNILMDRTLEGDDLKVYIDCVAAANGVLRVDDVRVRDHGQYVLIDVKIAVDADLTVLQGHQIADDVKQRLVYTFDRVQDVLVHVNPYFPVHSKDKEEGQS